MASAPAVWITGYDALVRGGRESAATSKVGPALARAGRA